MDIFGYFIFRKLIYIKHHEKNIVHLSSYELVRSVGGVDKKTSKKNHFTLVGLFSRDRGNLTGASENVGKFLLLIWRRSDYRLVTWMFPSPIGNQCALF